MTDWRGDLLKIGVVPDDMPDQTNFVLFNLDELNHFIKQLLLESDKDMALMDRDLQLYQLEITYLNEQLDKLKGEK